MPFRKEKIRARCNSVAASFLESEERIASASSVVVGASGNYWRGVSSSSYYVIVTDRRVLFIRSGARRKRLVFADPRTPGSIVSVGRPGFPPWLSELRTTIVRYRRPSGEVITLNFSHTWHEEMEEFVALLGYSEEAD